MRRRGSSASRSRSARSSPAWCSSESPFSHEAAEESLPLRDAFAVLFFVSVGMLFDPTILVREPLPVLATLAIIVVGKSLAALAIVRAFGLAARRRRSRSRSSLAQIGEFSFILAGLGMELGLLPKEGHDLILAGAILSIFMNPILFAGLDRWQARRNAQAPAAALPIDDEEAPGPPLPAADHVVLIGFGRVGSRVGVALHEAGRAIALIESDRESLDAARAIGIAGLLGNASSEDSLVAANIGTACAVLVAIPQTIEAGQIIEHARALKPDIAVVARAHSDRDIEYLLAHGADAAIMGEREVARGMFDAVETLAAYLVRSRDEPEPPA